MNHLKSETTNDSSQKNPRRILSFFCPNFFLPPKKRYVLKVTSQLESDLPFFGRGWDVFRRYRRDLESIPRPSGTFPSDQNGSFRSPKTQSPRFWPFVLLASLLTAKSLGVHPPNEQWLRAPAAAAAALGPDLTLSHSSSSPLGNVGAVTAERYARCSSTTVAVARRLRVSWEWAWTGPRRRPPSFVQSTTRLEFSTEHIVRSNIFFAFFVLIFNFN
jgi:hypothetical protein